MKKVTEKRKHPRFMKRLAMKFQVNHQIFMGMSGNLSEWGLFIKTNRHFAVGSPIEIELLLPCKQTAFLKGIVKRTSTTNLSPVKNGIGIQIIESNKSFMDFVKTIMINGESYGRDQQVIRKTDTPCGLANNFSAESITVSAAEKRQHRRFSAGQLHVKTDSTSNYRGVVINISIGGMLVKSDKRLNVGQTYPMKIGYKDRELFVNASVMWALLVENTEDTYGNRIPLYMTGMQFRDAFKKIEDLVTSIKSNPHTELLNYVNDGERNQHVDNRNTCNRAERNLLKKKDGKSSNTFKYEISNEDEHCPEESADNIQIAHRYFAKGKLAFWNGNYQSAKILLQNALTLNNTCARYFAFYARALSRLGKLEEAEKAICNALKYDPENSDYFTDAGDIYDTMGLSDKAAENYAMALSLQPSNIKAHKALFRLKKMTEDGVFLNKNPLRVFKKMVDR